jgi:hypothetical protein
MTLRSSMWVVILILYDLVKKQPITLSQLDLMYKAKSIIQNLEDLENKTKSIGASL